jgi:capsular polysaccharide biosynthesis protein
MKNPYLTFLLKHIKSLIWFTILGAVLAFSLSLLQERQYEAFGRLIIVSKSLNLDPYYASKAGERLGSILVETIYSNAFLNDVLKANPKIYDDFGQEATTRLKNWKKTLKVNIKSSSGVLELSIFHPSASQASQIAQTVFDQIITNAQKYIGGQGVEVKTIDFPTVSQKPVKPSLTLNTSIGALIGFAGTLLIIYLFSEDFENVNLEFQMKKRKAFPPPDLPVT